MWFVLMVVVFLDQLRCHFIFYFCARCQMDIEVLFCLDFQNLQNEIKNKLDSWCFVGCNKLSVLCLWILF